MHHYYAGPVCGSLLSLTCDLRHQWYNTGITTRVSTVEVTIPPIIGAAIRCITDAPVPCVHMMGNKPANRIVSESSDKLQAAVSTPPFVNARQGHLAALLFERRVVSVTFRTTAIVGRRVISV